MTVEQLVAEACRKSGVAWVGVDGHPPRAVWHVWHDGADYVLSGGDEQVAPGLAGATAAEVVIRASSTGARLVGFAAVVTQVEPGSAEWLAVEPLLRKARLHAEPDPTPRWRATAHLSRLTPA